MKNSELMEKAKVIKSTFYKIKNGDNVTTDVFLRIYNVLECDISVIVEKIKIERELFQYAVDKQKIYRK